GIRDKLVTGVQTCALPIYGENPEGPGHRFVAAFDVRGLNRDPGSRRRRLSGTSRRAVASAAGCRGPAPRSTATTSISRRATGWKIGRASCRERVERGAVGG